MGCLIDRVGEISNFTFCKFNVRGVQARAQVVSLHIAISFAVAILCMKDSESLQEASRKPPGKPQNLCSFPSTILFSPFSRGFVNSFQASQFAQRSYRYKQA